MDYRYLQPDNRLNKCFGHFKGVVEDRQAKEEKMNYEARDKVVGARHTQ